MIIIRIAGFVPFKRLEMPRMSIFHFGTIKHKIERTLFSFFSRHFCFCQRKNKTPIDACDDEIRDFNGRMERYSRLCQFNFRRHLGKNQ